MQDKQDKHAGRRRLLQSGAGGLAGMLLSGQRAAFAQRAETDEAAQTVRTPVAPRRADLKTTLDAPADLNPLLTPIRGKYDLPALGAALVTSRELLSLGVVGVRKYGDPTQARLTDQFHLGSDTKSMTATLVGLMVEEGKLQWTTPLGEAFPELKTTLQPAYRAVSVEHLLAHRSGFTGESWLQGKTFADMHRLSGTAREQRAYYAAQMLQEAPAYKPGTQYVYSNRNYALLGVLVERALNQTWEDICQQRLFGPLGMPTAGWGGMGTPGKVDQPWQYRVDAAGKHQAIGPGPMCDNPVCMSPAGLAHCSLADWAKYIQVHLRGEQNLPTLLKSDTIKKLHQPLFGGEYAGGCIVLKRPWGGGDGTVLTHTGSNNQNYAVAWLAPHRGFAALVATNQAGGQTAQACDEVAAALIQSYADHG